MIWAYLSQIKYPRPLFPISENLLIIIFTTSRYNLFPIQIAYNSCRIFFFIWTHRVHRTHRVATAAFWRTFHQDGNIILGLLGWGVLDHHPFTVFTITYKVAVYAPAEWADTLALFHLYQYVYTVYEPNPSNSTHTLILSYKTRQNKNSFYCLKT